MRWFTNDLRFALRLLSTQRTFSLMAIITLAFGIGITTAIFSVVNGILLRPLPFHESDRIVSMWETNRKEPGEYGQMAHPTFLDVQTQARSFATTAMFSDITTTLTGLGPATIIPSGRVTPGFFDVFGARLMLGRDFTPEEDERGGPRAVVLSHSFWKNRMGAKPEAVGTTIEIDGAPHRIVGVAQEGFDYPSRAQYWLTLRNDDSGCGRGCSYMRAAGRLAPGSTVDEAALELALIASQIEKAHPKTNTDVTFRAATLQDVTVGNVRTAMLVLLGAVGMVLLIACANVANLLLVRGAGRRAEMAVRSVLGAGRGRIVAQLMTENLVMAVCAGVLGLGLAAWFVDALRSIAPDSIPRTGEVGVDATTALFALALVLFTALLFGLAPALQNSRQSLSDSIRASGRGTDGGTRRFTRSAILVAEVALSVMLLLGAGLLLRSFGALTNVDPGFDPENVSTFTISLPSARYGTPDERVAAFAALKQELVAIPGVESVGAVLGVPLGPISFGTDFMRMDLPEPEPGDRPGARFSVIDEGYLGTLRIPVTRGRGFSATDRHGTAPVTLISRTAAEKYFPGEDPIGKVIHIGVGLGYPNREVNRTIVGIVADVHESTLNEAPSPMVYVPLAQTGQDFTSYVLRSREPASRVLQQARSAVSKVDGNVAVEYDMPVAQLVDEQLATPRFYLALISLFAVLAALLAAVGIYGVVSYLVANRTREIGIRMALGARTDGVIRLIVWQGLKPTLVGLALGLTLAGATVRIMKSLLFNVAPHDPLTYAGVTSLLIAVVLVACAIPAWRASSIAPGAALRSE